MAPLRAASRTASPGRRHGRDRSGAARDAGRPRRAASGTCAGTRRSRRRPGTALANAQLRAQPRPTRPATIRAKRAPVVGEVPGLGGAARGRPAAQGAHDGAPAGAIWTSSRRRSPRAAGWCTGRATPPRRTGSSPTWSGPPAPTRWSRSSRWPPRRSALNEALEAAGIAAGRDRPGRADRAARPRQAVAHPGAGHPPQPGRDPGDLPARDGRRRPGPDRRARPCWPMRRGSTCGGSSSPRRSRSAARTSRVAETGTLAVVESEGNGRMCLTLPETLITVMGIEKLVPRCAATWRCSCSCCRGRRRGSG